MEVADIGAGTGYFALPIARAVVPDGRVLAVDMQPEMLALLRERVGDLPITPVHGEATKTTLRDASVDLVLLANVWHELDDQDAALAETRRILRPSGRIAILDWRPDVEQKEEQPGPPNDHRIAPQQVEERLRENGWRVESSAAVGVYHYMVLATPS
jgi:ubiquinone/menaquinone biosynthesis C-methylase UbiE